MPEVPAELPLAHDRFAALVADLRPELHRYCSRLVGSAIDGEDVVQESLAKAFYALSLSPEVPPLKPWLLRIAHNTAIDFLRRYERRFVEPVAEPPELGSPDPESSSPARASRRSRASSRCPCCSGAP
jgi:RNA polymerase sigma-70 factor (ECF subfamily)